MTPPVQAVAAASDGSVWVGTAYGLHRFAEGVRGDVGQAGGSARVRGIVALHGDAQGRMWVATGRGIGRFDERGRFVSLIPVGDAAESSGGHGDGSRRHALALRPRTRPVHLGRPDARGRASRAHGDRAAFSILADREVRVWTGHVDGTHRPARSRALPALYRSRRSARRHGDRLLRRRRRHDVGRLGQRTDAVPERPDRRRHRNEWPARHTSSPRSAATAAAISGSG